MSIESVLNTLISILTGLVVCIPLVRAVIKTVKECVDAKSWNDVVSALARYMAEAEVNIENGATRKEWALGMIRATADSFAYQLTEADYTKLGELCDSLCDMAKVVNSTITTAKTE